MISNPPSTAAPDNPVFAYQKSTRYFAQVAPGLEKLAEQELQILGADEIKRSFRGLYFKADKRALYAINYQSRFCSRILAPLLRFDCHSTKYLYKTAGNIAWQDILSPETTFSVSANTSNSRIRHSQYAALCVKDAIADFFISRAGRRPSVDRLSPDVRLHLHLENNKATIYLDTSGGALHRRGYRTKSGEAPMQETVAAAIIAYSGWDGETPLYDPFCGSGTLLLEAHMKYCRIPAGRLRTYFGFQRLPDFDEGLWLKVKVEADSGVRSLPQSLIGGSDMDPEAVEAARVNAGKLPSGGNILLSRKNYLEISDLRNYTIVCNPPYGLRIKKKDDINSFMRQLGHFFKKRCKGSTSYVFLGKKELADSLGLRASWKKKIQTGGLDGVLLKYRIF